MLKTSIIGLFILSIVSVPFLQDNDGFDVLLKGGSVYTGASTVAQNLSIGIRGDKIVYLGRNQNLKAKKVIDASGLIVAPGFIDPHTHALQGYRGEVAHRNISFMTQGVTTLFAGNDGGGPVQTGVILDQMERQGLGTNMALFLGHGALRRTVLGMEDRAPTDVDIAQMKSIAEKAFYEGAVGLSAGLFYAPGSFSETKEVIEIAKIAASHGRIYDVHLRDESNYSIGLLQSVEETLEIGRKANIPVHIAHIKALGVDVWGQSVNVIEMIEQAQSQGVIVSADQYPWSASGTRVSNALLPRWSLAGGQVKRDARLKNDKLLARIKLEMAENLRRRGGKQSILLTGGADKWIGQYLGDYASTIGMTPVDAAVSIILEGDASIASFNMTEEDIQNFMQKEWVVTSSDGGRGHPRKFASFPRKYERYVLGKTITLGQFIRNSSYKTAKIFGLKGRGELAVGAYADILVFNPETYRPQATFSNNTRLSVGVDYLLINGLLAIEDGKVMPVNAGKPLREFYRLN
ncbi:amidohydrolase family protein [Temperatibacter marinus]|uniref:Amidohydrolase family protein n=1 Tax=Temperatibacter marinus TaxID=1456591 RepID=A0AA52EGQ1_9PROT|nr:amidohydrolase family protein [Temperatibacter marinus]WND01751.1 amidohydrolase family protein [Temperatibacter marinus]